MHFLLVNDDGISAPGIHALCKAVTDAGHRVSVCAPDRQCSATSHQITLTGYLHPVEVAFEGAEKAYSINGSPADCARIGLALIPDCDMVLSGINDGGNLGGACVYSGTVAAAMEASMAGKPALAVSQEPYNSGAFEAAAKVAVHMAQWAAKHPLPRGAFYNVNVPFRPYESLLGVRAATLAPSYQDGCGYVCEDTPEGPRFAYTHGPQPQPTDPNCDVVLCAQGYVTLTKLTWDMRMQGNDPDTAGIDLFADEKKHCEIERKYLIAMPSVQALKSMDGCVVWDIEQIYLTAEHGCTRRIRKVETDGKTLYYKTFKRRLTALSAQEDEGEISAEEYARYKEERNTALNIIRKTRLRIPHMGQLAEIDLYPFWTDRAVLEIELESEDETANIPAWLTVLKEVTDDVRYKNVMLAKEIPMD